MRSALITGITGQDGSYLAEYLLNRGYKVYGLVRRVSVNYDERIRHLFKEIELVRGDLLDQSSLDWALRKSHTDEIYNLAGMSPVAESFQQAVNFGEFTGLSVARMLEAIRKVDWPIRFFQASSSEMFGKCYTNPQDENTSFYPCSPYGTAKLYGHWMTVNYRENHNMYACCGILFNHESPRRGTNFVTRKISQGVARIKLGLQDKLVLGNLDARRDWGFAGDYVDAMWRMLQQDEPKDYVIATGIDHSVHDFLAAAFACVGIEDWSRYIEVDKQFFRPNDIPQLRGDASKAYHKLGWEPKVNFGQLVEMMVRNDLEEALIETMRDHFLCSASEMADSIIKPLGAHNEREYALSMKSLT
jgi:GDPmannose 4,6-dehydratase